MTNIVNVSKIAYETITFKYLEEEHTFVSADNAHFGGEQRMQKKDNIYNFNDFMRCVEAKIMKIITPTAENFYFSKKNSHKVN